MFASVKISKLDFFILENDERNRGKNATAGKPKNQQVNEEINRKSSENLKCNELHKVEKLKVARKKTNFVGNKKPADCQKNKINILKTHAQIKNLPSWESCRDSCAENKRCEYFRFEVRTKSSQFKCFCFCLRRGKRRWCVF